MISGSVAGHALVPVQDNAAGEPRPDRVGLRPDRSDLPEPGHARMCGSWHCV